MIANLDSSALPAAFEVAIRQAEDAPRKAGIADIVLGFPHVAPLLPPKIAEEVRDRISAYIEDEKWVLVATMAAFIGAEQHLEMTISARYDGQIAALGYVGRLIAEGCPTDLTRLVEDVCLDGWAGITSAASVRTDDDGVPLSLPPLVRHKIAQMAEDIFARHPDLLDEYHEEFIELQGVEQQADTADTSERDGVGEMIWPGLDNLEETRPLNDEEQVTLGFLTLDDLLDRPIPSRQWLFGSMLERGVVTLLAAHPGMCKTILTGHIAVAAAAGISWAGKEVPSPLKVVFVNNEETPDEIRRRFAAITAAMGVADREVARRILVWQGGSAVRLMEKTSEGPKATKRYRGLHRTVEAHGADLLIVDPLALSHTLEETSNADMTAFIELLQRMARELDCAILLVHHARKETGNKPATMDAARGASAIVASVRSMWTLEPAADDNSEESGTLARVELRCLKSNNSPISSRPVVLSKASISLSNGDDMGVLRPVTTPCSVSPSSQGRKGRSGYFR